MNEMGVRDGSRFHQIVKGISFNYWEAVSKGINSGLYMFSMNKNHPNFSFENCRVAITILT